MKKIISKFKNSTMFGFILGAVLFSAIGFVLAEILIYATQVSYSNELTEKTDVSGALDELLEKVKTHCPDGYVCINDLYTLTKLKSQGKLAYNENSSSNPFARAEDGTNGTNGVWEYDETTMDKNSDGGTQSIYYYRGAVSDNNVYFAKKCWKIIRTTSTGGVKIIYNGTNSGTEEEPICNGTTPLISTSQEFNPAYNQYYYSFYTYDEDEFLGTGTDSLIKQYIEGEEEDGTNNGYLTLGLGSTIEGTTKKWEDMLEDHPYCMDRRYNTSSSDTTYTQYESNSGTMYYGGHIRSRYIWKPALDCESEDQLTVANGRIAKKVSLMTVDEVMLAGGYSGYTNNSSNYLNLAETWWCLTPNYWEGWGGKAYVTAISETSTGGDFRAYQRRGVRPVVSLNNTAEIKKGDGTSSSPYIINPIS